MTKLLKPVRRETAAVFRRRPLIIQLEPPGIIRIKEKGKRTWYETSMEKVFSLAAKDYAARAALEKKKRKEAQKAQF